MSRIQLPRLSRIAIAAAASAALIGTTFIAPATAFAAPDSANAAAAAANDAKASNDAATTTSDMVVNDPDYSNLFYSSDATDNKIQLRSQIAAYATADGSGTASLTNSASGKHVYPKSVGQSIVDAVQAKSIYQVMTITNNSDANFTLNEEMLLPRFYIAYANDSKSVDVDPSAFKDGALDPSLITNPLPDQQLSYSYKALDGTADATKNPTSLEKLKIQGTLAPNATVTVRVPLKLPALIDAQRGTVFSIGAASYAISKGNAVPETSVRWAKPAKNGTGANMVPFQGQFYATTFGKVNGSVVYTALPSMQKYMPIAVNSKNYWVNNFAMPPINAATTQNNLYFGGYYMVDPLQIKDAVDTHGYAQAAYANGAPITTWGYQVRSDSANVVDSSGNGVPITAPYVTLRKVVTGNGTHDLDDNNSITVDYGSTFDAKTNKDLNLQVFDTMGENVDLSSPTVTIDQSKVDTKTAGTYPVTVTYDPDAKAGTPDISNNVVSNTFYVTVSEQGTPAPTPGESGSATPGEGAGGQAGSEQGGAGTGSEVKTSGTGSASDLAGIGLALAAAGAGAAAAARKIRRNRR